MITLTGLLICANAEEAALVRDHLPEHRRLTQDEIGCLAFSVQPTEDPLIWQVDEVFTDKAAFAAHQARTRGSDWFKATGHIRRDYQITGL
ncbi:antibiotic biosynthesis monooxygenase [Xinfangfangia sp. CPCC 101601]|uniref:Antibiotic biosynthesis monooxygenase n=1 Tax=Pseudogemmobacter lacusdianii TaxID=3069608 RepID=A0ABU0VVA9_9RHOB|nr:antibiotic biosynthesis monooxygenase [Xinfangfangia sp. CPCC 101601]MDQ2065458.1 antibiotic biosynthesis monooxygenase [Xinfangfangia sp. CPCC 101601]